MRDPKSPKGSQQPLPDQSGGEQDASGPGELEADLSVLGDEEIRREGEREGLRRQRDERKMEGEQENARRSIERWVQARLFGLLAYIAVVATVVVVVGTVEENVEIVRTGMATLCAVGGLGIYRLPFWVGRR